MDEIENLRRAAARDAAALARLAERTFRETFGDQNRPEDIDAHCERNFGEAAQLAEILDAGITTLVVERSGELLAYAQLGSGPAPDCVGGAKPAEIRRFYVDSAWHGKGIAQRLMARCLEIAAEEGADRVWLGVWEHNPRGIAFYRKVGFEVHGEQIFQLGTDPQRDLVLVRSLPPRTGPESTA